MNDYSQPDFYKLNQDSTALVNFVKKRVTSVHSVLDLGAGCGVLGIELCNHYKPNQMTVVEYQGDFFEHLRHNIKNILSVDTKVELIQTSFGHFSSDDHFDLVVCNPPYYLKGHGEASKDSRRGIARSFQHEGWNELIKCVERSLSPSGKAFIVIKNIPEVLFTMRTNLSGLSLVEHEQGQISILELSRLDKKRN